MTNLMSNLVAQGVILESSWSIGNLMKNLKEFVETNGGLLIMLIGTCLIVLGIYKLAKKLYQGQQSQDHWPMILALIIVGGACARGGWSLADKISSGGEDTILEMGGGMIVQHMTALGQVLGLG